MSGYDRDLDAADRQYEGVPMKDFSVYRMINGELVFWMNARGKTAKQMRHSVWWRNKGKVSKEDIHVKECEQGANKK